MLPSEGVAARITIVKGDGQGAPVGAALPESLVVRVTDASDRPVEHQVVTFAVTAGGGSVAPATVTTGADGAAAARWTLGPTAGPQHATATASGGGAPPNVTAAFDASAGVASTSIGVSSGSNPSDAGQTVAFTATLAWPTGAGSPTGTVVFSDGTTSFAVVPLPPGGKATASTAFATAGQHSVTARYSGDASFGGSTSPALLQQVRAVDRAPVAANDAYAISEDAGLTVAAPGVLANDTDPDGNAVTAVKVGDPAHGTLTLDPNGAFTYHPTADYNGADSFTYQASDGTLKSAIATVAITVNPVNDPPSFTKGPDETAQGGSGLVTVANWATSISPGPANESAQTVSFEVTNDTPAAFGQQPAIDASGTLTFEPALIVLTPVTATVTVVAHDDGGTANGGTDTSPAQQFTITITP